MKVHMSTGFLRKLKRHYCICSYYRKGLLRCQHDERPCLDGGVRGLVHGGHARAVELPREALDVAFQWHRPHARLEVEEALHSIASPIQD